MALPTTNTSLDVGHTQDHGRWYDVKAHFNAVGNGVIDDTTAIQNAINAVTAGSGVVPSTLFFPPGAYRVTSTLTIDGRAPILRGSGIGNAADYSVPGAGTTIFYDGVGGTPLVTITDCRHVVAQDIHFEGKSGASKPSEILFFDGTNNGNGSNELFYFQRCRFGAGWNSTRTAIATDSATYGVRFGGTNQNNDQFHFQDCVFDSLGTGFYLPNSQSVWGILTNCYFAYATTVAIKTSATVVVEDPTFNSCGIDIQVDSTAAVDVYNWRSENSSAFAKITGNIGTLRCQGGWLRAPAGYATYAFQCDALGGGGALVLDGVTFDLGGLGSMPNVYARGSASSTPGILTIRNCNGIALADMDVIAAGSGGGIQCDLRLSDALVQKTLLAGATLSTTVADAEFSGNTIMARSALNTTATDGFLYIPTCAGTPTGVPTAKTGTVPLVYDTTNNLLYVRNGGTWKKTTVFS